jgi:CPA2 family monovalent cation:H+ antiporter-2
MSGRKKLLGRINNIGRDNNTVKAWKSLMQALCYQTVSYLVLSSAFVGFGLATLKPLLGIYCVPIIVLFISPFLRAVVIRKNHSLEVRFLRGQGGYHGHFINLTILIRFVLSTLVIYSLMEYSCRLPWYVDMALSVLAMFFIIWSRFIKMLSIRIERTFKQNLCRRENTACSYSRMLSGRDIHIARLTVPELSKWAGKKLSALNFGRQNNVHIASILRGKVRINIPGGENMIFPGDVLEVVGDDASIEKVRQKMYAETTNINEVLQAEPLTLKKYTIRNNSLLIGKTLVNSGIRQNYRCTVIGFEDEEGNLIPPSPERIIQNTDTIWVVGEYESIAKLMEEV